MGHMSNRDYYNVLGVPRNAQQDEIKKSYRSLAMRWHPDRNPDDPEAEQHFKDITEAYRVIGDPDQRARYDRLGPLYNPDGRPPRPEELNAVVGAMFGNLFGRGRKKNQAGEDLRYTISLSLEEVASGIDKEIIVPRKVRCKLCGGDGADPDGGREVCSVCDGSGRSSGPRLFRTSCYHCEGNGFTIAKSCNRCSGEGRQSIEDTLTVKVPAGVATGQKLKLKSKGNSPSGSGAEGDLFVVVNVAEHGLFRRRGDDVLVELPLTYAELTLGADVEVPTLEGATTIRIPAGTSPAKIFRLAARGLPRVGRKGRGDLHLQVALEIPVNLSESEQGILRDWLQILPENCHPQRSAFDAAVKGRE